MALTLTLDLYRRLDFLALLKLFKLLVNSNLTERASVYVRKFFYTLTDCF